MTTLRAPDKKEEARKEDDRLLPLVLQAAQQVEALSQEIGAFEERLDRQMKWLMRSEGHPKYQERLAAVEEAEAKHEELLSAHYRLGTDIHRRLAHMSAEGRRRANAAVPGISEGIDWSRRMHYRYSNYAGWYYRLLEEGGTK